MTTLRERDLSDHSTTPDIENFCEQQIASRIALGFPRLVGRSDKEYRSDYLLAIKQLVGASRDQKDLPSLVEPRINFFDQLTLLGINIDPSVFYSIRLNLELPPHGVWLTMIATDPGLLKRGINAREAVTNLPENLRAATPFEGIII